MTTTNSTITVVAQGAATRSLTLIDGQGVGPTGIHAGHVQPPASASLRSAAFPAGETVLTLSLRRGDLVDCPSGS